jgi:cob(I)alamin adenosyltransferase
MKAKIYTKTGDQGKTSLVGGTRVAKTDPRLAAYGTLDELNSVLGIVRSQLNSVNLKQFVAQIEASLQTIQNNLFNIGSHLACEDETLRTKLPQLSPGAIRALEQEMDVWENELSPLSNFILPGGSPLAAFTHLARTVCRRAERESVALANSANLDAEQMIYLNRLSDWLFLLAREFNHQLGHTDLPWQKST